MNKIKPVFGAKQPNTPQPELFPSGRNVTEVTHLFEAITRCIQQARHRAQSIPLDLTLADFEIKSSGENFEVNLRPIAANRPFQSPSQDQPALMRLLYAVITGQTLTSSDTELALQRLAGTDLATSPNQQTHPQIAALIRQGLQKQFQNLNEINGALGFALYQENQSYLRSQRSSRINTIAELLPENESLDKPTQFRLQANLGVIIGLVVACLITLIALAVVSGQTNSISASQSTQATSLANNILPTFTPNPADAGVPSGIADSNTFNPSDYGTPPDLATANPSNINPNDGILHRQFTLADANGQAKPLDKLAVGQASLLNQPGLAVTGVQWNNQNSTVNVALNDGEYRTYDYTNGKVVAGQIVSDDGNTLATCWSADGRHYVSFTTDNQVIFHDLGSKLDKKVALPAQNQFLLNTYNYSVNNACFNTVTWSPTGQAALLRNFSEIGYGPVEEHFSLFSARGLLPLPDHQPLSAYYCRTLGYNPVWSPDGKVFGIFTTQNNNNSNSNLHFDIYNPTTAQLSASLEIADNPVACPPTATGQALADAVWLPDGLVARLMETPLSPKLNVFSSTVAIFKVPSDSMNSANSAFVSVTDLSRSHLGTSYGEVSGMAFTPDYTKLALVYYPAIRDAKGQFTASKSDTPRQLVIYVTNENANKPQFIQWSVLTVEQSFYPSLNYLSWASDSNEILGSDGAGNIGVWRATAKTSPYNGGTQTIPYSPLAQNSLLNSAYYDWSPDGKSIMLSNEAGLTVKDSQTQQTKLQFSAVITVSSLPNVNFTVGVSNSTDQAKIKLGQWSPDNQFYAARVRAHLKGSPEEGITPSYLGVWKLNGKNLDFDGLIQLGDIHANPSNNNWVFDAQKPIIYVVGIDGRKVSYDLTEPIPSLDKQPNLAEAANSSNSNSTEFFSLSSQSETLSSVLAWSPQANIILNKADLQISIDSMQTSKTISLTANTALNVATFSPDGKLAALGESNGDVRIIDTTTGRVVTDVPASQSEITALQFSPDGRWLVTGAADREVKIWQVSQDSYWPLLQVLQGQTAPISQVSFSPDGRYLLTNDYSDAALIWRVS